MEEMQKKAPEPKFRPGQGWAGKAKKKPRNRSSGLGRVGRGKQKKAPEPKFRGES